MDEIMMKRVMTIGMVVLALGSGLACVGLLIAMATSFSWPLLLGVVLAAVVCVATSMGSIELGKSLTASRDKVFSNEAEREVLNRRQQRELKRARGEVVMERALIEVQNERDNIVHRQLEAANDESKPPHRTQWTPGEDQRQPLPRRQEFGH